MTRNAASEYQRSKSEAARAAGAHAEREVARYLRRAGVLVVATNLRIGRFELDVVARDGPVVIVVEVRTRGAGAWVRAFGSIDWKKRLRIRRAAERLWRDRYARDPSVDRLRFDAASVSFLPDGSARVEYVGAAF